jgi:hypothetical protein
VKKHLAILAMLACGAALAGNARSWAFGYEPFKGHFAIYGGGLGDPIAPTRQSRNIAFWITGAAAKQMFDAMGPDLKGVCGAGDGNRIRQRAEVSCSYHPENGYQCNFGFDLTSGRSIGGSVC